MNDPDTRADRAPCASYTEPRLAGVYDALNPFGSYEDFYLQLAGNGPLTILDMGCGTGRLARALAQSGHCVTGADPAGGMLDIARRNDDAGRVRWIEAEAAQLDLDTRFDLIIMTGHVFQVFLSDEDVLAALTGLRRHLAPGGRIAFEMRNALVRDWETWTPEETRERIDVAGEGPVDVHYDIRAVDGRLVTFETHFAFADGHRTAPATTLRFMDREEVAAFLDRAGLAALSWAGDWDGSPCRADSAEIIVVACAAPAP